MARLFEIFPLVSTTRYADGSVTHDDRLMYLLDEDAESAFDAILEPYDQYAVGYLNGMRLRSPGPWAYVALQQEYDIAKYIIAQRAKLDTGSHFKFTYYDSRADPDLPDFLPKVGCLLFFSKKCRRGCRQRDSLPSASMGSPWRNVDRPALAPVAR